MTVDGSKKHTQKQKGIIAAKTYLKNKFKWSYKAQN